LTEEQAAARGFVQARVCDVHLPVEKRTAVAAATHVLLSSWLVDRLLRPRKVAQHM
jgi:hypothetical protein